MRTACLALAAAAVFPCHAPARAADAEPFIEIARPAPDGITILFGLVGGDGADRFGEHAAPLGKARLFLTGEGGKRVGPEDGFEPVKDHDLFEVHGLDPETEYGYRIELDGKELRAGSVPKRFHTWPAPDDPTPEFAFLAIGDFGRGGRTQRGIAEAMTAELLTDPSVQFVITLGDNIYAGRPDLIDDPKKVREYFGSVGALEGSGADDRDWLEKFFRPYGTLLERVPFFPALGNHDGNDSERLEDLAQYRDNFLLPFPEGEPEDRYYRFAYGRDVELFCLDTTSNAEPSGQRPPTIVAPESRERRWLERALDDSKAAHKIAYFHHPPFTAGPAHQPDPVVQKLLEEVLAPRGVTLVLCGHEHNYQETGPIAYKGAKEPVSLFISGGGGEVRPENVRKRLKDAHVRAFLGEAHFLKVRFTGEEFTVEIVGEGGKRLHPVDAEGNELEAERSASR